MIGSVDQINSGILAVKKGIKRSKQNSICENGGIPNRNFTSISSETEHFTYSQCSSDNLEAQHRNKDQASSCGNSSISKSQKKGRYRYGNYDRYYGSRLGKTADPRMALLRKEWIEKKSVLDIGCNVGFLTLSIAKDFEPRRIIGIDIDEHLIGVARKNIRHYCKENVKRTFPSSFYSHFDQSSTSSFSTKFPDNIWFRRENYVLKNDALLDHVKEEYDVILALSITKWIHLNWGDDGLKRFFRRAFVQLRPGGLFIIEPQSFDTYKKRAKLMPEMMVNYKSIVLFPDKFKDYLINEVGFKKYEYLGIPNAKTPGFERPLLVFRKDSPKFLECNGDITTNGL